MLSGFNTNIRHRGVLFHVQSEDSGRSHPHVITHLYHRGTIVASERAGYADRLEDPNLAQHVRELMESQHKSVLRRLRANAFDALIRERLGPGIFPESGTAAADTQPSPGASEPPRPGESGEASEPPAAAEGSSAEGSEEGAGRPFGEGIVSERPLDEVILGYLIENARKRRRRPSSG